MTMTSPAPFEIDADTAISVKGLWKIFGDKADSIIGSPDAGLSRPE